MIKEASYMNNELEQATARNQNSISPKKTN